MEEKVLFYDQLTAVLAEVPPNDRLFLLGDSIMPELAPTQKSGPMLSDPTA